MYEYYFLTFLSIISEGGVREGRSPWGHLRCIFFKQYF